MPCSAMMREPLGVEIGQAEMTDQAFLAQIGEVPQRVEIAPVAVIPPMELQQIETLHVHAPQRGRDRLLDDAPCHRPGGGDPFRESLDLGEPGGAVSRRELPAEGADEILGRAVMVGEVPGREPGIVIGEHRRRRRAPGRSRHARPRPATSRSGCGRSGDRRREGNGCAAAMSWRLSGDRSRCLSIGPEPGTHGKPDRVSRGGRVCRRAGARAGRGRSRARTTAARAGAAATGGVGAECLARSGGNPGGLDRRCGKAAARDPAQLGCSMRRATIAAQC